MRVSIFLMVMMFVLSGCISSQDFTGDIGASHLTHQCYTLKRPSFIFEGRCADLTGYNDNSELCNNIQAVGEGGFPKSWSSYLKNRKSFDKNTFDRLAFEKQRTMLAVINTGQEIWITKVVHHGWGANGRYWVVRGDIFINNERVEVELPSFSLVHHQPFWLNGRDSDVPKLNAEYLEHCK
jgi:hypothetical protein